MIRFAGHEFPEDAEVVDLVNVVPPSLEPLAELPHLRVLRLVHTNPHRAPGGLPVDLRSLAACPDLETVEVPRLPVRDLSGIEGHAHLRRLDVSSTRVDDLAPLVDLPVLAELRLRHTRVDDLRPVSGLPALAVLDVAHTAVADVVPLSGCARLAELDLRATAVTDLAPLHDLRSLSRVVVERLDLAPDVLERFRSVQPDVRVVA